MRWLDDWREHREQKWWDAWQARHRWDRLGTFNAERARGIVHTAEWIAAMAEEQRRFNTEHGYPSESNGFPVTLEPRP